MTRAGFYAAYTVPGFDFVDFAPGERVLDVGCGDGGHLRQLALRGCRAVGVDPDEACLAPLRAAGVTVCRAVGEDLGIRTGSQDGLVSCVVLPYTDERRAIREWGRVLRKGGIGRVSVHGLGFAFRQILLDDFTPGMFVYAARSIVNTWYYSLFNRRLPGWIGDTLCQTDRRMRRYFRENGLTVESAPVPRRFLGLPVFLYYVIRKQ